MVYNLQKLYDVDRIDDGVTYLNVSELPLARNEYYEMGLSVSGSIFDDVIESADYASTVADLHASKGQPQDFLSIWLNDGNDQLIGGEEHLLIWDDHGNAQVDGGAGIDIYGNWSTTLRDTQITYFFDQN